MNITTNAGSGRPWEWWAITVLNMFPTAYIILKILHAINRWLRWPDKNCETTLWLDIQVKLCLLYKKRNYLQLSALVNNFPLQRTWTSHTLWFTIGTSQQSFNYETYQTQTKFETCIQFRCQYFTRCTTCAPNTSLVPISQGQYIKCAYENRPDLQGNLLACQGQ